ncbi:hypothetical protein NDU88_007547 [Pleurodeles waltl]|uniref:Uncharacterized protein n=1 Tax=Pleurodeles waltl TaxID=8319 RepID=A0AAV7PPB5_PLEWA|nr:hypothetical protein NDU88_007547 [Pleurodeles waltl]
MKRTPSTPAGRPSGVPGAPRGDRHLEVLRVPGEEDGQRLPYQRAEESRHGAKGRGGAKSRRDVKGNGGADSRPGTSVDQGGERTAGNREWAQVTHSPLDKVGVFSQRN